MNEGKLVPDDIIIGVIKTRLQHPDCRHGYILDGFPRTVPQAKALDNIQHIDIVINYVASNETIISRITGRRVCRNCHAIYHIKNIPPKRDGICDRCGGELYQREDDKIEKVKPRLEVYRTQTAPLIEYYKTKGILVDIDAEQSLDKIFEDTCTALKNLESQLNS